MRLQVLLLLILQTNAEETINCTVDKRLIVTRNDNFYKLQLCTSMNDCTKEYNFIRRDKTELCGFCQSIPGIESEDCQGISTCEESMNSFLNDSCKLNDHQFEITNSTTKVLAAVLGVMTGLFLVILGLVITGWGWTCWTSKKHKKRTQFSAKCQDCESEEERFCPNQLYEMTTTEPVVSTAIEQLLDSLVESGQSNNGFSSKDNKGYRDVKRVDNVYTSSEGSTQSSFQEEQTMNRVEEGESREKHVYHILEKPGGDNYEDLDKDLEENTATEYETTVPLN